MEATDKFNGKSIGLILLAAGKSTRLGQPKQLLNYEGQTLLQHSLQVARTSDAHPVVVVLGADARSF
jgi:molybdenum cofactor cytidylyltransferase